MLTIDWKTYYINVLVRTVDRGSTLADVKQHIKNINKKQLNQIKKHKTFNSFFKNIKTVYSSFFAFLNALSIYLSIYLSIVNNNYIYIYDLTLTHCIGEKSFFSKISEKSPFSTPKCVRVQGLI